MFKSPSVQRSKIMASVKASGNKSTEIAFLELLRKEKLVGWRRHFPLIGNPDFVFPRQRLSLFIDGCFWHGCRYHCRIPQTNRGYWQSKIANNKVRDLKSNKALKTNGWKVIRIWEHEIKTASALRKVRLIKKFLRNNNGIARAGDKLKPLI